MVDIEIAPPKLGGLPYPEVDGKVVRVANESGRGQPHSKTSRTIGGVLTMPNSRTDWSMRPSDRSWSAAVLCRFSDATITGETCTQFVHAAFNPHRALADVPVSLPAVHFSAFFKSRW